MESTAPANLNEKAAMERLSDVYFFKSETGGKVEWVGVYIRQRKKSDSGRAFVFSVIPLLAGFGGEAY